MDITLIEKLIAALDRSGVSRLEVSEGNTRIVLDKASAPVYTSAAAPVTSAAPAAAQANAAAVLSGTTVKAPLVGTVYRAREPGADPFVAVGKKVKKGDVLCLIEAMKMFNEIKAPEDGVILEVLFSDGDLAEYGAPLFAIGA